MISHFGRPPLCPPDNRPLGYTSTDIDGVATGGNRNYCAVPGSAYHSAQFTDIWQFSITYPDGRTQPVYCLEKGVRGPQGQTYRSMPIAECLPASTPEQQARVLFILANSYPAITAAQQFACAGVDPAQDPALNDNDAYAAAQVALWSVFNPPQDKLNGWQFLDCVTGAPHPKSDRLRQSVSHLYESAAARAGAEGAAARAPSPFACCAPPEGCCSVAVGGATLYNCGPGELRRACGKLLYGPLMVCAEQPFELSVCELEPGACRAGFITLSDGCGNQITHPASGQEFYLAFPPQSQRARFQLSLMIERTEVSVAVLCDLDPLVHLQAIGAVPMSRVVTDCACMMICFDPPCEPKCAPPKPPRAPRKPGMKVVKGYR